MSEYETGFFESGLEIALNDLYTRLDILDEIKTDLAENPRQKQEERTFLRNSMEKLKNGHKPTWEHSVRVALKAYRYGRWKEQQTHGHEGIQWTSDLTRGLVYSTLMHDYGKLKVPLELLIKSENLKLDEEWTAEDKRQMNPHVGMSFNYLIDNKKTYTALVVIRGHAQGREEHRYPKKLPDYPEEMGKKTKEHIEFSSKVLSILDWFDSNKHRDNGYDAKGNALEKLNVDVIKDMKEYYSPLPEMMEIIEELEYAKVLI